MADPRLKPIKIKTGVVKRLAKEKQSYIKESNQEEAKWQKMKDDGKDEHDVRKQHEVFQESANMIPDSNRRLKQAYAELEQLLEKEADLAETEEFQAAKTVLDEAKVVMDG
ncbi:hypothetical protein ACJMK2_044026 [Sinanodonta woodiana]|uniref:Tubulin-specific chaperone A n=1 Tax=Sinanodonta woodiana TaxID=1069815 RepID=A0ABD3VYQ3_SINWO